MFLLGYQTAKTQDLRARAVSALEGDATFARRSAHFVAMSMPASEPLSIEGDL
jgi:hypothetical protein